MEVKETNMRPLVGFLLQWRLNCASLLVRMISDIASDLKVDSAMTLSQAQAGCQLRICKLQGKGCRRLREIGFCEQMRICKLSNGRNMLCSMCGTKLAVSRKLGEQVLVEMV